MADVREYQAVLKAYDAARVAAAEKIKMIEDVSSALRSDLPSFFGWQYDGAKAQKSQIGRYNDKAKFDMKKWPDAGLLKSVLMEWHGAFTKLHDTWNNMDESDRIGFQPPPDKMATS